MVTDSPQQAVVRISRDFGEADISTTYTLEEGSDRIHLVTEMTNRGSEPLTDLMSGFTLWPDSGYEFAVPGLAGVNSGTRRRLSPIASSRMTRTGSSRSTRPIRPGRVQLKDMYLLHSLAPGESRSFEGWLQVGPSGDLAPVIAAEIERGGMEAGTLSGKIGSAEGPVEDAVLVIEKDGSPYAWTRTADGSYQLTLPAGDYTVYATAQGYSETAPQQVVMSGGGQTRSTSRT